MLRHGGAPIWTALTVKTGEITGISFPTAKVGPGPIRTLIWTALTVETGEITGISFPTGKVGPGPIRTLTLVILFN